MLAPLQIVTICLFTFFANCNNVALCFTSCRSVCVGHSFVFRFLRVSAVSGIHLHTFLFLFNLHQLLRLRYVCKEFYVFSFAIEHDFSKVFFVVAC